MAERDQLVPFTPVVHDDVNWENIWVSKTSSSISAKPRMISTSLGRASREELRNLPENMPTRRLILSTIVDEDSYWTTCSFNCRGIVAGQSLSGPNIPTRSCSNRSSESSGKFGLGVSEHDALDAPFFKRHMSRFACGLLLPGRLLEASVFVPMSSLESTTPAQDFNLSSMAHDSGTDTVFKCSKCSYSFFFYS